MLSQELYERALKVLPGGVNSPVRAMRQIGREPIFVERGEGCELIDVDGNRYVDWVGSWGPLILGHAHPDVLAAVDDAAGRGTSFGAATAAEVELAEEVVGRVPSVEMVRMTSSGTEAAMSAVRLARAVDRPRGRRQVRRRLPRPLRRPARRGRLRPGDAGDPGQPGRHRCPGRRHRRRALERPRGGRASTRRPRCRRGARRADRRQHGRRAARRGLPRVPPRRQPRRRRAARLRRGDHRLPRRPRRRPAALRGRARPDRARQGDRRRPARRRLRRAARADGADRPGRRRLPGRHALGEPARRRRRPRDPARARRRCLRAASPS